MDSKALNRRAWIKNITIIFLAVMLFLTFFSNTIMNFSLPEVSAQYASSGTITSRIRKTGNVEATEDYEVILDETRDLLSVEVKKGQSVAIGDLLFTLEEGDSKEVDTAIAAYETALLNYEKSLLELDKDYTSYINAINNASNELTKLRNKLENIGNETVLVEQYNNEIKELKKEKSELEWQANILKSQNPNVKYDYSILGKSNDTVLSDANKLYTNSKADYENAKVKLTSFEYELENIKINLENADNNKKAAERSLESATTALTNYESSTGTNQVTEESILQQKRALEALQVDRQRAIEELSTANSDWQKSIESAYTTYANANADYANALDKYEKGEIEQSGFLAAEKALQDAFSAYNNIQSTKPSDITSKEHAIEDIDVKIRNAKEDLERDEAKYTESQSSNVQLQKLKDAKQHAQNNLDDATYTYNEIEKSKTKAEENITTAKENITKAETLMNGYMSLKLDTEVRILEEQGNTIQEKIDDLDEEIKSLGSETKEQLETQIETAEKTLKGAQESYDIKKKEDNKSGDSALLQLEYDKKNLDRLESEVERLQKNNVGTEIRAKVAGVISSINYVAGNEITAGSIIAKIQIVDKGYYVEFDVTNEEATRIRPGEKASLQYYWGSDIDATVESIINSTSNPGKAKTVRISISGEIDVGRSLTFNLGERGQSYDTVIPKSAVREDSNGKFILTVVSKSTPLGNRYTATRVDISVLEEDDTNCAISLGLYGNEFIITTSTKPIKDGDQVRLIDR